MGKILAAFCTDKKYDLEIFKESRIELPLHILLLIDAGYQGMTAIHPNSPRYRPKKTNCIRSTTERSSEASLSNISSVNSKSFVF
jgi:hypothetical protein